MCLGQCRLRKRPEVGWLARDVNEIALAKITQMNVCAHVWLARSERIRAEERFMVCVCDEVENEIWKKGKVVMKGRGAQGRAGVVESIYPHTETYINVQYEALAGDEASILQVNIPDRLQIANISPMQITSQAQLQNLEAAAVFSARGPTMCSWDFTIDVTVGDDRVLWYICVTWGSWCSVNVGRFRREEGSETGHRHRLIARDDMMLIAYLSLA